MEHQDVVASMIDKIVDGNNTAAKDDFEALISAKITQALDDKKQEIATSVYSNSTGDEDTTDTTTDLEIEDDTNTEEA